MMYPSIKKEAFLLVRDGRFVFVVVFLVAVLLAMHISALYEHHALEAEKQLVGETAREQWDNQGEKHPHRGAHFGIYVFRPNTALSSFDPGIVPYIGQSLWLEPHRRNMTRFTPATDAGPAHRLIELTPAFILYGLFPLIILSLALSQIPQEREQGTLRMLHCGRFSIRALLISKLFAQGLLIGAVLLPLALVTFTAQLLLGQYQALVRTLFLTLSYGVFYLSIGALGLALGAYLRSVRASQLLAILIWAGLVAMAPRLASGAVTLAAPLPDANQFWSAIEQEYVEGPPGGRSLAERVAEFEASLLAQYKVDSLEDVPIGVNAARRLLRDAYADQVYEKHFDQLWTRFNRQERTLQWMAALSPVIALRNVSMAFSGTSLADQHHFETAAESYRRQVNTAIDKWDMHNTQGLTSFDMPYADEDLWRSIGEFQYDRPSWLFAWRNAVPGIIGLGFWSVISVLTLGLVANRGLAP